MLTRQQIFNTAYHGLAAQGFERSFQEDLLRPNKGRCQYRGDNGRRCALGYCIPDSLYSENLEGVTIYKLPRHFLDKIGIRKKDIGFANNLQQVHDFSVNPSDLRFKLELFAAKYGLTIPELPVKADGANIEAANAEDQNASEQREYTTA